MEKEQAKKYARYGSNLAYLSAALQTLITVVAIEFNLGGELAQFNDPWNLIDVLILIALGYGMRRFSRAAAVTAFAYWLLSGIFYMIATQTLSAGIGLPIWLYFFARAIQGTFAYHKTRGWRDRDYRPAPKWTFIVGIPGAAFGVILMTLALLGETGVIPDIEIVSGTELPSDARQMLYDRGILLDGEELIYFYSTGMSYQEDGNILTDMRVVSYEMSGGELRLFSAPFEDVVEIVIAQRGDAFSDTVVEVYTSDGSGFVLFLSAEEGGDDIFIAEIEKRAGLGWEDS